MTACSLPSLSDYAAAAAGNDAGPVAPVAPVDAGAAPSADGGSTLPAADAGFDGGKSPVFVCPSGALFCDDFEGVTPGAAWTTTGMQQGGVLAFAPGATTGHAFSASIPSHEANGKPWAFLQENLATAPYAPLTIAMDLNLSTLTNVGYTDIDFLRYQTPFYRCGIRIADYGTGFYLHDYGDSIGGGTSAGAEKPLPQLVPGQWVHVVFSISFAATDNAAKATLSFDGKVVYDGPMSAGPYAFHPVEAYAGIASGEDGATSGLTVLTHHFTVTSP